MRPKTVLILEDNADCRALLAEMLAERDLEIIAYPDPETYFGTRRSGYCITCCPCTDFILTDNHMFNMTGLEYLEQRKEQGCKMPYDRVAILSGNLSTDEKQRAQQLGCRIFHKPFEVAEIYLWLDAYLPQTPFFAIGSLFSSVQSQVVSTR